MWKIFSNWSRLVSKNKLGNEKLGHFSQLSTLQPGDNNNNNNQSNDNLILKQQQSTITKDNIKIKTSTQQTQTTTKTTPLNKNTHKLCNISHKLSLKKTNESDDLPIKSIKTNVVIEKVNKLNKQEEYVKSMDDIFNELDKLNTQIDAKWENLVATQMLYNHEYDEAIPYLKIACSKGSIKAIYNLAICLKRGLGVEKNEKLAFSYFKKAADNGHPEAQYNCAIYYLNVLDDYESCLVYLRNSVKLNLAKAKKSLAMLLVDNHESFDEAFNLLISLNEHDAESAFYTGFCYENGFGCLEDSYRALEWYKKSYELGYEDAKLKIVQIKLKKLGDFMTNLVPKSKEQHQLGHFTQSLSKFDTLRRGSLKTSASYSQFPLNDAKQLRRNSSKPILCAY